MSDPFDTFVPTRERIATPFTTQATIALARGWFPIPVKGKSNVPAGVTGHAGVVDADKVRKQLISRELGYDNLAVRHDGTIAIDVDVRNGKNGVESMAQFAAEHGLDPLPPTYSSTARGDEHPSRQYFFRLPEYVKLESKPRVNGRPADDVEICQYHHRYSVVYPSVHPEIPEEDDPTYYWYTPGIGGFSWGERTKEMPRVEDLPELPAEWIEALSKPDSAELNYDVEVIGAEDLIATFRDGEPSPPVRSAIELAQTQHPGHDETYSGLYKAFMYGREKHPGVKALVSILVSRHRDYLETEHPHRAAKGEVEAIVRDASEKAQRSEITSEYRPYNPLISLGMNTSSSPGTIGLSTFDPYSNGDASNNGDAPSSDDTDSQFILPRWVWKRSPELAKIYAAARARMVSPDVVLHACLATLASMLHYGTRLETGKGPTVLSYYAAAVGASGSGKTEGLSCAETLMDTWRQGQLAHLDNDGYTRAELGTGEGMVEAYMGTVTEEVPQYDDNGDPLINDKTGEPIVKKIKTRAQVRHNAMFASDEGRQMLAIASRPGATIMSTLCSMWSGTSTGAANAKSENSRTIARGSYILGLLVGFQPATMDALFSDEAGGAPQRFLYASTKHPDITADEVDFPPDLSPKLPPWAPIKMTLSDKHRRMVREHLAAINRDEVEQHPLDGHRLLLHCRVAALLALLHSQTEVTDETWDLAETIVAVSCEFRNDLAQRAEREKAEEARRRTEAAIKTAVTSAALVARNDKVTQAADKLIEKLEEAGGSMRRADARRGLTTSLRSHFDEAVETLLSSGRIVSEDIHNPETQRKVTTLRLLEVDEA